MNANKDISKNDSNMLFWQQKYPKQRLGWLLVNMQTTNDYLKKISEIIRREHSEEVPLGDDGLGIDFYHAWWSIYYWDYETVLRLWNSTIVYDLMNVVLRAKSDEPLLAKQRKNLNKKQGNRLPVLTIFCLQTRKNWKNDLWPHCEFGLEMWGRMCKYNIIFISYY